MSGDESLARITVVIPARDAAGTLDEAVRSALRQTGTVSIEVVIAVAPSADDTAAVAARLAAHDDRVRVVDNPTGTTPAGLNLGIRAASAPVVARLDAHARLPDGYLRTAREELARDARIGNVGGRQQPVAEQGFARAVALAMASRAGSGGATYRHGREPADVDTVYLGVFRRAALEQVGGYDERLPRNQDYELNHRLRAAGWTVRYLPALAVTYRPRSSPLALWRQYQQYGAWKRRVLALHPRSVKPRQLAAPALVLALITTAAIGLVINVWWPLAAVLGLELVVVTAAGAYGARREPARISSVAAALLLMHLSWGVGFLMGRANSRAP